MLRGRLLTCTVAVVAAGALSVVARTGTAGAAPNALAGPSAVVGVRQYIAHPDLAPLALRAQFARAHALLGAAHAASVSGRARAAAPGVPHVFNRDDTGLPQDEEAVSTCHRRQGLVISGTNDYRGLVDQQGNFTGWYYSNNSGRTVVNEGLLPTVKSANGDVVPSGGDPTFKISGDCKNVYGASIDYGSGAIGDTPSVEAVYRSTPHRLRTCPQGGSGGTLTHPRCWPDRRAIATAAPGHFIDKDWLTVGTTTNNPYVWIAFDDLSAFNSEGNEESGVVEIVRCSRNLAHCSQPVPLSTGQKVAEYPTVTVGPDGRTYVTWGEFFGDSFIGPTQRGWLAVAAPGSLNFTSHPIVKDHNIIRAQETLHANDFRVGTMWKNTVTMWHGHPEVLVAWEHCRLHAIGQVCEEPQIRVTVSGDLGATWSKPHAISAGGDNIFPYLDTDPDTSQVVAVWYTNRFDPVFHNRQDVEMATLTGNGRVEKRLRVTRRSNETESDPILQGQFIGDYIQVDAMHGQAYVAYNANRRSEKLLGQGFAIPQQDNYLVRVREPGVRSS